MCSSLLARMVSATYFADFGQNIELDLANPSKQFVSVNAMKCACDRSVGISVLSDCRDIRVVICECLPWKATFRITSAFYTDPSKNAAISSRIITILGFIRRDLASRWCSEENWISLLYFYSLYDSAIAVLYAFISFSFALVVSLSILFISSSTLWGGGS